MKLFHAMLDGEAVIFAKNDAGDIIDAFWYVNNGWSRVDSSEVSRNAALLSETEFNSIFGILPQLPNTAFQP